MCGPIIYIYILINLCNRNYWFDFHECLVERFVDDYRGHLAKTIRTAAVDVFTSK